MKKKNSRIKKSAGKLPNKTSTTSFMIIELYSIGFKLSSGWQHE